MRGRTRTACGAALAVLVGVSAGGCTTATFVVGAAAGGAAYAYVRGEGKQAFAEPMGKTRAAVVGALEDLGLPVLHKDQDAVSAKVKSVNADGKDIVIDLSRESDKVTMVTIRVGVFGDRALTKMIFGKIDDRLEAM